MRQTYRAARRTARRARRGYYSHGLSAVSAGVHRRHGLDASVTIVASKRTGSTWVQELMSGGARVCPIFEPLEGDPWARELSRGAEDVLLPGEVVPDLEEFLARAMRGAHVTRWSMKLASQRQLLGADRFVVKHVQLCRAAGWLAATFPDTPMVLVVRHPCAVVQSMLTVPWSGKDAGEILAKRPDAATQRPSSTTPPTRWARSSSACACPGPPTSWPARTCRPPPPTRRRSCGRRAIA